MLKKIGLGLSLGMILTYVLLGVGGWLLLINAACNEPPASHEVAATTTATQSASTSGARASRDILAPSPDLRSPTEIAQAACGGRCSAPVLRRKLGAAQQAIIPSTWTVPSWFIDPSNSIGCASDANSGTSATCVGGCSGSTCPSGVGPLATFQELNVHRWQCFGNPRACPRLRQTTTLNFLSNHTTNADTVVLYPSLEAGASLLVAGALGAAQQVATGTLQATTSKNRATATLLSVQLALSAVTGAAAGQLLVNATHSSRAWLYATFPANPTFKLTQPLAPVPLPIATASTLPAEVDTSLPTDAWTLYNPVAVDVVDVRPIVVDFGSGAGGGVYLSQLTVFDASGPGNDNVYVGPHVYAYDVRFDRSPFLIEETQTDTYGIFADCYFDSGFYASPVQGQPLVVTGGTWTSSSTAFTFQVNGGLALDGDFIFNPQVAGFTGANLGLVYIESSHSLNLTAGPSNIAKLTGGYPTAVLWGPGNFGVAGSAHAHYDGAQAGGATNMFVQTGTFQINGGVGLCTTSNSSTTLVAGNSGSAGAVTGASLDAACGATGYGGNAFVLGGATLTKNP